MSWTTERFEVLKTLWADGLSASQIAAEIGLVTRNAVISKVHRSGLPRRATKPSPTKGLPKGRRPKIEFAAAPRPSQKRMVSRGTRVTLAEMFPIAPPVAELPADAVPIEQRQTVLTVRTHDCRWPYGRPGEPDFFFCGAPQAFGSSYCPEHTAGAWARTPIHRKVAA